MVLPIGHSAMPASFKCAQANGIPMMVTAMTIAVMTCPSASHHPASTSQRKQGVSRNIERGPGPGQADDRNRHDDRGDQPADSHPRAAEDNPENIQEQ
jgi:hypothetical protein